MVKKIDLKGLSCPFKVGRVLFCLIAVLLFCGRAWATQWIVNKATMSWMADGSPYETYSNLVKTEYLSLSITRVIGPAGGEIEINNTKLTIPAGALDAAVSINIELIIISYAPDGDGACGSDKPIVFYRFSPDGLRFNKACTLTLSYKETDLDTDLDGTNDFEEDVLRIFWWDKFHWRLVGGLVDKDDNIVTASIAHFSDYALFPLGDLDRDAYRPRKRIITPDSTYNDCDRAYFDNLDENVLIKIFDITGRKIRTIDRSFYAEKGAYWWDGRDDAGNVVESGVYIYQFKVGDLTVSGTIAVAK